MTVLIVSHLYEPSVNKVIAELDRRNVPWFRINCEEFPLFSEGSIHFSDKMDGGKIRTSSGSIDIEDIRSVWFRRWSKPALPKSMLDRDKEFVRGEAGSFLHGFLDLIDANWVNDRAAERAATKIRQLRVASRCGFEVPRTLITNAPDLVRDFVGKSGGSQTAFKPVSGFSPSSADFSAHMLAHFGSDFEVEVEPMHDQSVREIVFCQLLTDETTSNLSGLRLCPVIFQDYIDKAADIRVTIVGQEIFACRIRSQENPATKLDFRRMVLLDSINDIAHEEVSLPIAVIENLLKLMRSLNLIFGCVDLLETKDGNYIFLEVNPSGQWLWIESLIGFPISSSLAGLLSGDPGR